MHKLAALLLCLSFAAVAQSDTRAAEAAEKAAAAAQKAAEAAQSAAESAARSAAALEKAAAAPAAAAPKTADAPVPAPQIITPPAWTGLVGLGLIAVTGNAQTLTFNLNSAFEHKTETWIHGIKASAVYGQGRAAGATDTQTTALAATVQARGDRRFTEQLSLYLLAGIDTDHLKSIEERPYGEAGVSLIWWDEKVVVDPKTSFQKSTLRTDLGFRYGHEYRYQYFGTPPCTPKTNCGLPGVDIIAPHAGALLRYAINRDIIFSQDADLVANLVNEQRLLLTTNSKLSARLTQAVSLGITFTVNYDSAPAPMKQSTDTALSVGIEVGL